MSVVMVQKTAHCYFYDHQDLIYYSQVQYDQLRACAHHYFVHILNLEPLMLQRDQEERLLHPRQELEEGWQLILHLNLW